jgi:beta-galactosidase
MMAARSNGIPFDLRSHLQKDLSLALRAGLAAVVLFAADRADAQRIVVPLDGTWAVAESVGPDEIPASFDHSVAVPGLVNQARPAFADVDQYETHEFVWTMKLYKVFPESTPNVGPGRTRQKRNYFWYQRTFTVPAQKQSAVLVINKAQFGTAVWLNGKKVGEHLGCSTAARLDVAKTLNWSGENRLLVRVGAHPGVVPEWVPLVNDGEKQNWTPGIYDSVSLCLAGSPVIDSLQVAPRIDKSEILVQTRLKNPGPARSFEMVYRVKTWKGGEAVGGPLSRRVELGAGEEKLVTHAVPVPGATLWSPDNPFLYVLDASTGGDDCSTRFGMREFRCDSSTGRAMLNGRVIYLRGASITLHRFFGDAQCGNLPWDDAWVRKFLVEIPRRMHWNCFRVCIGPAPQKWLDVADEAGLLLQYEFPIWSDREPLRHKLWKPDEVMEEFREFVRDNWNHPSVVIWDSCNETRYDLLGERVIPEVRRLDLSNRPWENGYNKPHDANDPVEQHPYLFGGKFQLSDLDRMDGKPAGGIPFRPHAAIINEYDWLWLHRDGTPTFISKKNYDHLLGPGATPAECIEFNAYALAGLTEFWRAYRNYAGVMYYGCLDGDRPVTCVTCDNFRDVKRLEFHAPFDYYVGQSFKPLGVYVHFWQPSLPPATERRYPVILVNDAYEPAKGRLELGWEPEGGGQAAGRKEIAFEVPALGRSTYEIALPTPTGEGKYVLSARAFWDGKPWSPTVARRKVAVKRTAAR